MDYCNLNCIPVYYGSVEDLDPDVEELLDRAREFSETEHANGLLEERDMDLAHKKIWELRNDFKTGSLDKGELFDFLNDLGIVNTFELESDFLSYTCPFIPLTIFNFRCPPSAPGSRVGWGETRNRRCGFQHSGYVGRGYRASRSTGSSSGSPKVQR